MVSMKEIAKNCGVSVATVSKALNNKSDIPKATRDRIRKVADEMGYTLNASARALKTNRTYNLGVLFVDKMSAGLAHDYFSEILESFKKTAEDNGYDITFINNRIGGIESTYLMHCKYRSFDGVIIITADFMDPQILELVDSDIPLVSIDFNYENCSSVISDNTKGMRELVKYAHSMGHEKIAFIHGEMTDVTKKRLMGFYSTCREFGIDVPDEYIVEGKYHDIECNLAAAEKILALPETPTCIFFPDDYSLLGVISRYDDRKDDSLRKLSVAGYDGIKMARFTGLTTYQQDAEALGKIACRRLVEAIENPEVIHEHSVVSGTLIPGKTIKKI